MSSIAGSNITGPPAEITIVVDPGIAPLADYGGPTQTMPPLPGSPPIDAATSSTRTRDQRGFAITGTAPDIGAAEFQGTSDLELALPLIWEIDHDDDGNPFGVEFTLGTQPFAPDDKSTRNLGMTLNASKQRVITFGYNPNANDYAEWVLKRSTDLMIYDVELYRFNGTTELFSNDATGTGLSGDSFEIIDPGAAGGVRFFYRFEAVLRPEN